MIDTSMVLEVSGLYSFTITFWTFLSFGFLSCENCNCWIELFERYDMIDTSMSLEVSGLYFFTITFWTFLSFGFLSWENCNCWIELFKRCYMIDTSMSLKLSGLYFFIIKFLTFLPLDFEMSFNICNGAFIKFYNQFRCDLIRHMHII